jgi:predicted signal transduction protein with EAL and GGDEF domain
MRNECGFFQSIDACIAGAQAGGQRVALLLVGIDVTQTLCGWIEPEARPALAERAARRLARCVEEEAKGGAVAPLRADTFGVLLPRLRSGLQARDAANRILGTLACPFRPNIGIAIYPCDGPDAPALLRCAAAALARARHGHRPTYRFYLRGFATSAASPSALL